MFSPRGQKHVDVLFILTVYFYRFREGLSVFGALAAMEEHCDVLAPVFLADQKTLCASDVVALFVTRSFSLAGSNRKRAELKTIAYWRDWLLQVEGKKVPNEK